VVKLDFTTFFLFLYIVNIKDTIEKVESYLKNKVDRKYYVFGLFLVIATILWFLNALSKKYTTILDYPVVYKEIPNDKMLTNDPPATIKIKVNARGFKLLQHILSHKPNPVVINITDANQYKLDPNQSFISTRNYTDKISDQLSSEIQVENILTDSLFFAFSDIETKRVAVIPDIELQFEKQHQQKGKLLVTPDSIDIAGPKIILDSIDAIYTKHIAIEGLNRTTQRNVGLQKPQKIKSKTKRVTVTINVEKFTQQSLKIPIELVNIPDTMNIKLLPGKVTVDFFVGLSNYNTITSSQFQYIIDIGKAFKHGHPQYLKPALVKYPGGITIFKEYPQSVDYIIEQ